VANPVKTAKQMFDQFLAKHDPAAVQTTAQIDQKTNNAARVVAAKGGAARAARLSPKKRRQIAKRAAKARWSKP